MMDITSFQSIQQQINQNLNHIEFQKNQYLYNLKSQCQYKKNALKTAENLIQEYKRQNKQLKLEVIRLSQKIQNFEEIINIYKYQIQQTNEKRDNKKTYEKQLFKSTTKLTEVLEKYSELQDKYRKLEKQLVKYKNFKKEYDRKLEEQSKKQEQSMKQEISKQFNNFLRTPLNNKSSKNINENYLSTNKSTHKKVPHNSLMKNNNKNIYLDNFTSEQQSLILKKSCNEPSTQDKYLKDKLLLIQKSKKPQQTKKSIQKFTITQQNFHKRQPSKSTKKSQVQQVLQNKIKIFQWKLKQKDEQIMLMLRRNKEIENKYDLLKKILDNEKNQSSQSSSGSGSQNNSIKNYKQSHVIQQKRNHHQHSINNKNSHSSKTKSKKQKTLESQISQIQRFNKKIPQQKIQKNLNSKDIHSSLYHKDQIYLKNSNFITAYNNNDSTDLSTWKSPYHN